MTRLKELNAKSLPAMAIDGKLAFECNIPPEEDLIAAIKSASLLRTI
jgi:hypothetical protein